jgi:hypothetical protein
MEMVEIGHGDNGVMMEMTITVGLTLVGPALYEMKSCARGYPKGKNVEI